MALGKDGYLDIFLFGSNRTYVYPYIYPGNTIFGLLGGREEH